MSSPHLLLSISSLLLLQQAVSIPLSEFYLFGTDTGAGDAELASNDDGSTSAITLSAPFPFFGSAETDIYVRECMQGEYIEQYLISGSLLHAA